MINQSMGSKDWAMLLLSVSPLGWLILFCRCRRHRATATHHSHTESRHCRHHIVDRLAGSRL